MRVLAFCDYFAGGATGGAERVADEVCTRLAKAGADVTVLTTPAGGSHGTLRVESVPGVDLSGVTGSQTSLAPGVFRRALQLADEITPDVLHCNTLFFQTSLAAAFVRQRRGIPLVTTVHIGDPSLLSPGIKAATRLYEQTAGRAILHRSASVIAVSASVASYVRTLGARHVEIVPNGVDHDRFFPAAPARRERLRVLFVGRLIANKGPHVLLDAVRGLDGDVEIAGDGPMRARLEYRARDELLPVRFVGAVDDVPRRMRDADVVVRPSFTEGMPLVVLEAMASGVLVIASGIPGNTDLVEHGHNGLLVAPGDATALADALRWAAAHPEERRRLADAGRGTALAYTWDRCAQETEKVLRKAAG